MAGWRFRGRLSETVLGVESVCFVPASLLALNTGPHDYANHSSHEAFPDGEEEGCLWNKGNAHDDSIFMALLRIDRILFIRSRNIPLHHMSLLAVCMAASVRVRLSILYPHVQGSH